MKFFDDANNQPRLFVFYLGGKIGKCNIEMHDVVFVVAKSDIEVQNKVKEKWIGSPKSFHIDSWFRVDNVDGFEIEISTNVTHSKSHNLFFINLGYYLDDVFGESHFMTLVVASSRADAIQAAQSKILSSNKKMLLHTDNIYDVDECINIHQVDQYHISLKYTGNIEARTINNGYQKV